jgi:hypothetical protein
MKNNQKISISFSFRLTSSRLPRPFEAVLVWLRWPAPAHKQPTQNHATHKSTDVRPPRDAAHLLRTGQRRCAAKQINQEPEDKIKYGRNFEEEGEKEDWKQDNESRCRKKYQVRTKHARNRA